MQYNYVLDNLYVYYLYGRRRYFEVLCTKNVYHDITWRSLLDTVGIRDPT
jgi:hypothetical protein